MSISRLSVVNDMLALLGEMPINDLLAFHPVVPRALATLDTVNETVQAGSWWFNTEYPKLEPQVGSGFIMLADDILSCDTLTALPRVTKRGTRLYNLTASTYIFTAATQVVINRLVPFDELSTLPRAYIRAAALVAFNSTIDGDAEKGRSLHVEHNNAYALFNAEHIRHQRTNMFNRPGVQRILNRMVGSKRNMLMGR